MGSVLLESQRDMTQARSKTVLLTLPRLIGFGILLSGAVEVFPQSNLDEFRAKIWANGTKWEEHVTWLLYQEFTCKQSQPLDDRSPCNYFVGNALSRVYGVNDFKRREGFLTANEIYEYVIMHGTTWKDIGFASSQEVAKEAQSLANKGYPIIALRVGNVHGHVALIIPGKLIKSSSWNMDLPNSAAFILDQDGSYNSATDKNKTYVGQALSWSWSAQDGKDVKVFYRKDFIPSA